MPRFPEDAGVPVKLHGLFTFWACVGTRVRPSLTTANPHMLHMCPLGPGTQVWVSYPIGARNFSTVRPDVAT